MALYGIRLRLKIQPSTHSANRPQSGRWLQRSAPRDTLGNWKLCQGLASAEPHVEMHSHWPAAAAQQHVAEPPSSVLKHMVQRARILVDAQESAWVSTGYHRLEAADKASGQQAVSICEAFAEQQEAAAAYSSADNNALIAQQAAAEQGGAASECATREQQLQEQLCRPKEEELFTGAYSYEHANKDFSGHEAATASAGLKQQLAETVATEQKQLKQRLVEMELRVAEAAAREQAALAAKQQAQDQLAAAHALYTEQHLMLQQRLEVAVKEHAAVLGKIDAQYNASMLENAVLRSQKQQQAAELRQAMMELQLLRSSESSLKQQLKQQSEQPETLQQHPCIASNATPASSVLCPQSFDGSGQNTDESGGSQLEISGVGGREVCFPGTAESAVPGKQTSIPPTLLQHSPIAAVACPIALPQDEPHSAQEAEAALQAVKRKADSVLGLLAATEAAITKKNKQATALKQHMWGAGNRRGLLFLACQVHEAEQDLAEELAQLQQMENFCWQQQLGQGCQQQDAQLQQENQGRAFCQAAADPLGQDAAFAAETSRIKEKTGKLLMTLAMRQSKLGRLENHVGRLAAVMMAGTGGEASSQLQQQMEAQLQQAERSRMNIVQQIEHFENEACEHWIDPSLNEAGK